VRLAREPRFRWFGRWNSPVGPRVRDYLHCVAAAQPGAVPLMAVMRHHGKGCGGYTGGGPAEDARTRSWYREFAQAVASARVIIGFEPDSLGTIDCLTPSRRDDRTRTDHPKVDAYMWINRPGYSAGACNGGPLPVGSWWSERALMYARWQTNWLSPPNGTANGFRR
jgi:hypothetical protein